MQPLASGLAPTSIKSMVTQRIRWARGVIQSIRNTKLITNKGLSVSARISYLLSYSYWWSFGRRLVFTFAPIMFALFDLQVVNTTFCRITSYNVCYTKLLRLFTTLPKVDAGLAASIFHFGEVQIPDLKQALHEAGIPMRRI